jgi:hypothetical protein
MSKEEKKLKLQLGDIIKLDAPNNSEINDKIYFINYISISKIELLNEDKTLTLSIDENGNFLEESIENILLLYRQESPSYIVQNNFKIGKNISVYFGEPLPFVLNGTITNIEEDMIEITSVNKEIIYIDFAYSGIPDNLNIEKIVLKESDAFNIPGKEIKEETEETKETEETEEDEIQESVYLNLENKDKNDIDLLFNEDEKVLNENLGDEIIFEEVVTFVNYVNVPEDQMRYILEEQITDFIDNELNNYKIEERSEKLINNINLLATRFKELRNNYSNFDENKVPYMIELNDEFYKPLKENLINLNKKIYWILPVATSKKILYYKDDEINDELDDEYIIKEKGEELILELTKIVDKWSKNNSKDQLNDYKKYINDLTSIFDSNIAQYENGLYVKEQMNVVNDIYDDFYSYLMKNEVINKQRFVLDVYNEGMKMLESYYVNFKKQFKNKDLTTDDKINLISFITLPLSVFNFSKINHNYTNIQTRANLNLQYLNYSHFLNKNTNIDNYIFDEQTIEKYKNTHENIHNNEIFGSINNFMMENSNIENSKESYIDSLNNLIDSFIPTNNIFIKSLNEFNIFLNYKQSLDSLQVAGIDFNNLDTKDMDILNKLITSNIEKYKTDYKLHDEELNSIINILNKDVNSENFAYSFEMLNKELQNDIVEIYNIDSHILNNDEIFSYFIRLDNGRFFMSALNKNIIDLIVGNLLESFIKESKKLEGKKIDETIEQESSYSECENYFLSKKYNSLEELENDNNKLIFFDTIYDNTFYSLKNDFSNEKETMDDKGFYNFLTNKIIEKMNITKNQALREAKAIMEEKREVIDGDYAVLINKEDNKNYIYIRSNNIWELDDKFKDTFYIDSNKIFCDSSKECISKDDKCMSSKELENKNLKNDVDKILDNFKAKYDLSIEQIQGKINDNYEKAKNYVRNIVKINHNNKFKINYSLLQYDTFEEIKQVLSPYEKIRDNILAIPDHIQKNELIKKFCLRYTRYAINDENTYWLYCIKSGAKLMPLFLLKLANVFSNKKNYLIELDAICAEQGTISDDNNYWVDKYSGYIIKRIEFSNDEGYDEQGFKLMTKQILEEEYSYVLNNKKEVLNPDVLMIKQIFRAMSDMMSIKLNNDNIDLMIKKIISIQNKSIPSKIQYEKLILKTAKKEGQSKKMLSYEDTYNLSLLMLSLTFFLLAIQLNIPTIKSKKTFPGCIKSFSGYPYGDINDKTSLIYVACVANKIKTSVAPWNTILKMSESIIMKKIESLIEKFVLIDSELDLLKTKKESYLITNKEAKLNEENVSISKWHNFFPPLIDLHISSTNMEPLDSGYENMMLENITNGKVNFFYETINSKIIYCSNKIIESIQNVVKKNSALLENSNGEPFLENSCCNELNNTMLFFLKKDKTIIENNNMVVYYNNLIQNLKNLSDARILYHNLNTKLIKPKIESGFNENIIYKSFIYYCNFENKLPIDDEIKSVCMDKPIELLNEDLDLREKIDILKNQGKNYNKAQLDYLLDIVNKRNIVANYNDFTLVSNIDKIRLAIENYNLLDESDRIDDDLLISRMTDLLDTYDIMIKPGENENLRTIKNYIVGANNMMKSNIINYIKKLPNISKSQIKNIETNIDNVFGYKDQLFYNNYMKNLLNVFPNIIKNKNINYNSVPKHWNLSEIHERDVANILSKYYNELMSFSYINSMDLVFKIIQNRARILMTLLENIKYYESIDTGDNIINGIFDKQFIQFFNNYVFYSIFNDLINITSNPEFLLEITNYEEYNEDKLKSNIVSYISLFMNIMISHNTLVNNSYEKVKSRIIIAKEKEKDLITEYLKDLTEEEREIENLFKNNKLEKWSKGLKKGLTQYVKENYDEERMELEKQALKEKMLNKVSNVTNMNKEIYELDMEEKMQVEEQIDKEAYDMSSIPDDDDYESDYEYN